MTNQNVHIDRHGPQNKGCNQASADSNKLRPPCLNDGNVGRSVFSGFWKSTFGSSLAKTSEAILLMNLKLLTTSFLLNIAEHENFSAN